MSRKPREPLTPTRLDVAAIIRFSLWFFLGWLIGKLFIWEDWSWWVGTAPMWSSMLFTTFTTNYHADGREKTRDDR